jgi:hypothetical protein
MDIPKTKRIWALGAAGIAFVAFAAALTIAFWPENTATAKRNFCTSLDNFSSAVVKYQGLDPVTATNADYENAADDLDHSWSALVDDANDWVNAYDNPLTSAYDDLYRAIQDLPSDDTIAQDVDALEPQLSALGHAYRDTFDGSGCSTV